jgi:hypothetical protein
MPQPVAFNTGSAISGSIQTSKISYAVDGDNKDYRGGYAGKTWYSELSATNGVVFAKDTTSIGRGVSGSMAFWTSATTSSTDILFTANRLPGSPGNFATTQSAYSWSLANGWFLNHPNEPFNNFDADGLILCLDAAKIVSYPETSSTWYDISGYNNSGSLINGPTFNTNGWLTFDGVDDYVSINNNSNLVFGNGSFSVSIWIRTPITSSGEGTPSQWGPIVSKGCTTSAPAGTWWLAQNGINTNRITFNISSTAGGTFVCALTTNTLSDGWHNIVATRSGSTSFLYQDNRLVATDTTSDSNLTSTSPLFIGTNITSGIKYTNMALSQVSIYNRALSQAEILQNYYQAPIVTNGLVLAVDAGNIVSYESGSTIAYSLTGSLNGSLINGVGYLPNNGGTWDFDGTDDYLNFSVPSALNFTSSDAFSTEAWINWDGGAQPNNAGHIIGKTYGNYRTFLLTNTNPGRISFRLGLNTLTCDTPSIILTNTWYHVVSTFNPSTFTSKIYVNGVERASNTNVNINWSTTSGNFQIGNSPGENYYFNGKITNGRVYKKTLTPEEVSQNFNAQRQRFGI